MFDKFYPDIYAKDIFSIDYEMLKTRKIKCLLFDLDNTLATINETMPAPKVKELVNYLEGLKFKVIIMTNSSKKRALPFKEHLNVDTAYRSMKPLKRKFKKILKIYHYKVSEIAMIGDQILTDVYGANRMGITSIFINKRAASDFVWSKLGRKVEEFILNYFHKKDMWTKGKYYD